MGAIAALASMVEEIAVGRDWVVVLTSGDRDALTGNPQEWLLIGDHMCSLVTVVVDVTGANAMVTRISLFCKVAAPVAFSLVMSITSTSTALNFTLLQAC